MKRKFWNWVKNEGGDEFGSTRTLFLNGEISDETWYGDEVTPAEFRSELDEGEGPITLWINSPGGDVFAAAEIYNMLMDYRWDVTVKIDALAASAASVIAMAGTKVLMSPVALMMIHNPATIAIGDAEEMQKAIDMLSEVKESIVNAYEIKTSLSRHKISQLMDGESWMNAKEAVKLGFADGILYGSGEKADEEPDSGVEMLFSRKAVTDSLLSRLVRSGEDKKNPLEETERGDRPLGEKTAGVAKKGNRHLNRQLCGTEDSGEGASLPAGAAGGSEPENSVPIEQLRSRLALLSH